MNDFIREHVQVIAVQIPRRAVAENIETVVAVAALDLEETTDERA